MRPAETRHRMARRVLGHLARTTIAAFPLGPGTTVARVTGVARPLLTPLQGAPCVGYAASVSWLDGNRWLPLIHEWNCASFDLADDSGEARVDATGIDVAFRRSNATMVASAAQMWPGAHHLLARHGHSYRGATLWFDESILHLGDEVVVCGVGCREPIATRRSVDYRSPAATRLVLRGNSRFPLAVSNEPIAIRADGDIPPRWV